MSRINANTTLRVEDYPPTYRKDLLPRLFQTLNLLITQIVNAINGNVEFGVNIPSQDNALEFNFSGTLPSYKWTLNRAPRFVLGNQALEDGQLVFVAYTWSYNATDGLITITSAARITSAGVGSLQRGSNYRLNLRTLA